MSDNSSVEDSSPTQGTGLSSRSGRVCSQCRKQKQRCDRQNPCRNCSRRNIPHLCTPTRRTEKRRRQNETSRQGSTSAPRLIDSHIGNLWPSRGAPSYHGNSYFGHQAAAIMMQVPTPDLPVGLSTRQAPGTGATRSFRNERGPYGHVWELMGYLPRQKSVVDMLTERFLTELNGVFDGVHEESFRAHYADFWDRRRAFDDLTNVDLRWLSLLFIILAFSELLDCPQPCSVETQQDREESSLHFYWAARKCVVIAPTFSGESADIVRAGILITRYLIYLGRIPESWLTGSFAVRMAQAQGMHVDGERWGLPRKVLETRRRLWSTLYYLDRTVALAVGRPYTVNDKHCEKMKIINIWLDDLSAEEVESAHPKPLSDPTPATYHLYQQQLASILGSILDDCFALAPTTTLYRTYERAMELDRTLVAWAQELPSFFQLEDPDRSLDIERPFLPWHRLYLHSAYHFARVTLHRPYVLLPSITGQFRYSQEACFASACAHLTSKLSFRPSTMAERFKFNTASHHSLNSTLVLAVMAVRDPHSPRTAGVVADLQAYCEKQNADRWVNEFQLAEVKVVEVCISRILISNQQCRPETRYNGNPATSRRVLNESTVDITSLSPAAERVGGPAGDVSDYSGIAGMHSNMILGRSNQAPGDMTALSQILESGTWEEILKRLETEIVN